MRKARRRFPKRVRGYFIVHREFHWTKQFLILNDVDTKNNLVFELLLLKVNYYEKDSDVVFWFNFYGSIC